MITHKRTSKLTGRSGLVVEVKLGTTMEAVASPPVQYLSIDNDINSSSRYQDNVDINSSRYLDYLNDEYALAVLPAIIVLGFLMVRTLINKTII